MDKFIKQLTTDKKLRTRVMLYAGAAVNFIFVGIELYGGIRYRSAWFTALAVYYGVLTTVKLLIGLTMRKGNSESEWQKFRAVGWVMTVLNLALMIMISVMIAEPSIALHDYGTIIAITMAAWTFYLFISAIVSLVKLRGQDDAMMLASKIVKFVGATVSVLMLQTAMIASFGTHGPEDLVDGAVGVVEAVTGNDAIGVVVDNGMAFLARANRITGVAVGLIVLGVTIYMIVRGTRENKRKTAEKGETF